MELRLLGPVEVEGPSGPVAIGGPKERALLAFLALRANEFVSEDALTDALWADDPPRTAARTLQAYLSRLRKVLAEAQPNGTVASLESRPGGWMLKADHHALDVSRVEQLLAEARAASASGDSVGAALALSEAQHCWRGRALSEFADVGWAVAAAVRFEELRLHVTEERIESELACGRHGALVGELESLCAAHPLRERLWGQRMLALYRAGRQAEALRAYQHLRRGLGEELGIEPSPTLMRLEQRILQHDIGLEWDTIVASPAPVSAPATPENGPRDTGVVTLMFTDIVRSTELLGRLGDDAYDEVRRAHFRLLRDAVADAGGSEVKNLGDGLMAVFASSVDALTCAVATQQLVARHKRRAAEESFDVRIGIHVGEPIRDADDYFGTSVVVARRLCDEAQGGQILASRLVADFVGTRGGFRFANLGPLTFKGIEQPIGVCVVEWAEEPVRPLPASFASLREHAFVGREAELADLGVAWQRAQAGRLEVVLLAGEPGIGKTTLAVQQATAAWGTGAIVLFGRCDEESLAPFQPFVEALVHYIDTTSAATLRAQLGAQAADIALLAPQLGRKLPEVADVVPTGAETERYRLFEAVPALLRAMGHEAPVLLILDDLHWADRPTLQLLQHVIRRGAGTSMLVVGTYRDTDLVRTHPMAEALADMRRANLITRLPIRGLSRTDVLHLVAGGGEPTSADTALGEALWTETEGSPLFLREILRHLTETEVITRDESGRYHALRRIDQLGIPEGVREVIGRRLNRLSDATNVALRCGSVLGRELRLDVLESVTDLTTEQLLDALDEATEAGVIVEAPGGVGRYSFTHALVRQALYDELSLTRRVRLHQRVGEALEHIHGTDDGSQLAELAFHFSQSAVAGTADKAIEYARRAGEHAKALVAYEDAARHFATALEVSEDAGADVSTRADLLLEMGSCHWLSANISGARSTFARVADIVGDDPVRLARAALGHAGGVRGIWVEIGIPNEPTIELLERALAAIGSDDSDERARLLACLAQELHYVPDTEARRDDLVRSAIAMARRLGDPATLAYVLCASNLAIMRADTSRERTRQAAEAAALAEALGDRQLLGHSQIHLLHGLWELNETAAALRALETAETILNELKDPLAPVLLPAYRAGLAVLEGRFDDAEALYHTAFRSGQEIRDPNVFVIFAGGMGTLRMHQGRIAEINGLADEGYKVYPILEGLVRVVQAGIYAESGAFDLATEILDSVDLVDPRAMHRDAFWLWVMHMASRATYRIGDRARAATLYELLLPYANHNDGVGTVGWGTTQLPLAWCAATLGRYDTAIEHYAHAEVASTANGFIVAKAEAQTHHAAVLVARGRPEDRERATTLLAEAELIADHVGMPRVLADIEALRARLAGETPVASKRPRRFVSRRDRARALLSVRGRAAVKRWTRNDSDEDLVRRFGQHFAQRALFSGLARSFQPAMAFGFNGDLVFELLPPEDELDPAAADWWTIEVRGRKATARRGGSDNPAVSIHAGLADFVRLGSGELHSVTALLEGRLELHGDVLLGARLSEMFGAVEPLEELAQAAEN